MIDTSEMLPAGSFEAAGLEEAADLEELALEARRFLEEHEWCGRVKRVLFDRGFSKAAVFFCEIEPLRGADPTMWVIVGDLPPAYLDIEGAINGAQALECYVVCVREWAEAVREHRSTAEIMPVLTRGSLEPILETAEHAEMIETRLRFIEDNLLSQCEEELRMPLPTLEK